MKKDWFKPDHFSQCLFSSWLLGDHLGSTSMVADASGAVISELRYSAFGEIRYQSGLTPTDFLYTGQRQEAEIGLYYYVARWYDPAIGRFIQADTIVPNPASAKGFDRYAYGFNNPLLYLDPSGHVPLLLDGMQLVYQDFSYSSHVSKENVENTNNWHEKPDKNVKFPNKNYNHKPKAQQSNSENGCVPCLPESPELPELPPFTPYNQQNQEPYGDPDVVQFWDLIGEKAIDLYSLLEQYSLYSKGGWKYARVTKLGYRTARATLPLGLVEAFVESIRQGTSDAYYHPELKFSQRAGRVVVVGIETLGTDVFSGVTGGAGASGFAAVGSTLGVAPAAPFAVVGYGVGATAGTALGDAFWTEVVNPYLFEGFGMGDYP